MPDAEENPPFEVAEEITRGNTTFQILEYRELKGGESPALIERLYALNRAARRLRQLRIRLNGDAVRTEPGALQFMRGEIEMESSTGEGGGFGGLVKGAITAARTGETIFKPMYRGRGDIYLEPTFGHIWLIDVAGETLYADQGLFRCAEDSLEVGAHKVESASARWAGGEGRHQTRISGSGMVALSIPVPRSEVLEIVLNDETLSVDGSFGLLRTGDVRFTVEKASNSIAGAVTSGEGLLSVFRGTGKVWVAPTQPTYEAIERRLGLTGSMKSQQ